LDLSHIVSLHITHTAGQAHLSIILDVNAPFNSKWKRSTHTPLIEIDTTTCGINVTVDPVDLAVSVLLVCSSEFWQQVDQ